MSKRSKEGFEEYHLETMGRLAATVRRLREARGMSLRELADNARVGHSDIFRIESGATVNPSLHLVNSIARALDISLDELLRLDLVKCPTCKGSGWIPDGEGSSSGLEKSLESIAWDLRQALLKRGVYLNNFDAVEDAIAALCSKVHTLSILSWIKEGEDNDEKRLVQDLRLFINKHWNNNESPFKTSIESALELRSILEDILDEERKKEGGSNE